MGLSPFGFHARRDCPNGPVGIDYVGQLASKPRQAPACPTHYADIAVFSALYKASPAAELEAQSGHFEAVHPASPEPRPAPPRALAQDPNAARHEQLAAAPAADRRRCRRARSAAAAVRFFSGVSRGPLVGFWPSLAAPRLSGRWLHTNAPAAICGAMQGRRRRRRGRRPGAGRGRAGRRTTISCRSWHASLSARWRSRATVSAPVAPAEPELRVKRWSLPTRAQQSGEWVCIS